MVRILLRYHLSGCLLPPVDFFPAGWKAISLDFICFSCQVEAIVVDDVGKMVVSLCLEGRIVSWDAYTGENLATIDRAR